MLPNCTPLACFLRNLESLARPPLMSSFTLWYHSYSSLMYGCQSFYRWAIKFTTPFWNQYTSLVILNIYYVWFKAMPFIHRGLISRLSNVWEPQKGHKETSYVWTNAPTYHTNPSALTLTALNSQLYERDHACVCSIELFTRYEH